MRVGSTTTIQERMTRELAGKPDMPFRMHESGLHYYDLRKDDALAFIETVFNNLKGFTK